MKNHLWLVILTLGIGSCDDDDRQRGATAADAKAAAQQAAGPSAADCGSVEVDHRAEANCCFASNRAQSLPAYALYEARGTESAVALAISSDAAGHVRLFQFEATPGDTAYPDEGRVTEATCPQPAQLIDDACNNETDYPFVCSAP